MKVEEKTIRYKIYMKPISRKEFFEDVNDETLNIMINKLNELLEEEKDQSDNYVRILLPKVKVFCNDIGYSLQTSGKYFKALKTKFELEGWCISFYDEEGDGYMRPSYTYLKFE